MNNEVRPRLESVLDSTGLGRRQALIVLLCAMVALIDGFDTQAIALVAPEIAQDWGVAPAALARCSG
jgi:AAHS family 4-hydroxybenzoate transporter-like MFS transporter